VEEEEVDAADGDGDEVQKAKGGAGMLFDAFPAAERDEAVDVYNHILTGSAAGAGAGAGGGSKEKQTVVKWLAALSFDDADAVKYAAALKEIGIDIAEDMYSLEAEDLEEIKMKKFHRKKVLRSIAGGISR